MPVEPLCSEELLRELLSTQRAKSASSVQTKASKRNKQEKTEGSSSLKKLLVNKKERCYSYCMYAV